MSRCFQLVKARKDILEEIACLLLWQVLMCLENGEDFSITGIERYVSGLKEMNKSLERSGTEQ